VASEGRKMMKSFSKRHTDLNKGDDANSIAHLMEMKEKKMMAKKKKQPREARSKGGYVGDK
jgi:hypothetical protein